MLRYIFFPTVCLIFIYTKNVTGQIIDPSKGKIKTIFKKLKNDPYGGFAYEKHFWFDLTCNNDDSAFFKQDTLVFYSGRNNPPSGTAHRTMSFFGRGKLIYSGYNGYMNYTEPIVIPGRRGSFKRKFSYPRWDLKEKNGKTFLKISRYNLAPEVYHIHQLSNQRNQYDDTFYIFVFVRVHELV